MEDCVINCGGPIEPLADTTEAGGGTEAAALRTDLPEDATTTHSLTEAQQDLLTTLAAQNGTAVRVGPTAAVAVRPTEAPGMKQ